MGKKEKKLCVVTEEIQAMINLVPKLKELLGMHKEIAEGYHKYRKNGGAAIPGIEKHLCFKEPEKAASCKSMETVSKKEAKEPKEAKTSKKAKKGKEKLNSADPIDNTGTVK